MRVISTPASFRAAVGSLLLLIPLAAFEAFLASRLPWWRRPQVQMGWAAAGSAFIIILLGIALSRGRRWAFTLGSVLGSVWIAFSVGLAIRLRHPGLGYFALFLGIASYCLLVWIRREMGRSFFDPGLEWYQGRPKGIPGLTCELGGNPAPWKVGRIDHEGAFLFIEGNDLGSQERLKAALSKVNDLLFRFRDREIKCSGVAMRELLRATGAGFRFQGLTLDQTKEMGDFVEILRGEGYVE